MLISISHLKFHKHLKISKMALWPILDDFLYFTFRAIWIHSCGKLFVIHIQGEYIEFWILCIQLLAFGRSISSIIKCPQSLHDPSFPSNMEARHFKLNMQACKHSCSQAPGTRIGASAPGRDWIAVLAERAINVGAEIISCVFSSLIKMITPNIMNNRLEMKTFNMNFIFSQLW